MAADELTAAMARIVERSAPLTSEAHRHLSGWRDVQVRRAWARRDDLPASLVIERVSTERDPATLEALLGHVPHLDEGAVAGLARHGSSKVAVLAAVHPLCPDELSVAAFKRAHHQAKGATENELLVNDHDWPATVARKPQTAELLSTRFDVRVAARLAPYVRDAATQRLLLRRIAQLNPEARSSLYVMNWFAKVLWVPELRPLALKVVERFPAAGAAALMRNNLTALTPAESARQLRWLDSLARALSDPARASHALVQLRSYLHRPSMTALARGIAMQAVEERALTLDQRIELARFAGTACLDKLIRSEAARSLDDEALRKLVAAASHLGQRRRAGLAALAAGRVDAVARVLAGYPKSTEQMLSMLQACGSEADLRAILPLGPPAGEVVAHRHCPDELLVQLPAVPVLLTAQGAERVAQLVLLGSASCPALRGEEADVFAALVRDRAGGTIGELLDSARALCGDRQ